MITRITVRFVCSTERGQERDDAAAQRQQQKESSSCIFTYSSLNDGTEGMYVGVKGWMWPWKRVRVDMHQG